MKSKKCKVDYPEYTAWRGMKIRCYSINTPYYKYYGGKGITVCKRWRNNFYVFLEDMGSRPNKNYSIDRIDNNKGYSKSNCRWATKSQQMRNRNYKNSTGFRGVYVKGKNFGAKMQINNKKIYLGSFKNKEKAYKVYCKAYKKLHGVLPPK